MREEIDAACVDNSPGDAEVSPQGAGDVTARVSGLGVLAALGAALSACGGGGGGGSSGGSSSGGGGVITPVLNYTDTEAARFLLQAQFTAKSDEILAVRTQGYSAWLSAQFSAASTQTATAWLDSRSLNVPTPAGEYFDPTMGDWMSWRMMMTGADQVRKRFSLALSEMMVASLSPIDGFYPPYVIGAYWDLLNANVFGNFRTLLEKVTLNAAMGFFLNTKGNLKEDPATGREPDENYAREVMQLFTIGLYQLNNDGSDKTDLSGNKIETYVQADITNLAHVFTGYDWDYSNVTQQTVAWLPYPVPTTQFATNPMSFDASKHSNLAVTFLGTTIPANTPGATALKTALDTLFNHPNVGPFFARQMIQRLVTSNPSPAYINRVANAFNNNGSGTRGDLKAVWTAILTDTEARTLPTGVNAGKLREPVVRWAQWARTFPVSSTTGKWEVYDTSASDWGLGQSPLRSPSVFNFFRPGYVPPQTAIADAGQVAPEFQLHNETTTAGYINFMATTIEQGYNDVKPDYSDLYAIVTDSQAMVDWLDLHLTASQLSTATKTAVKAALDSVAVTASSSDTVKYNRIHAAVMLVMCCPEYLIQK